MGNVNILLEHPDIAVSVRKFRVDEGVSDLFRIQLTVVSPLDSIELGRVVGHRATLTVAGATLRVFRGIVNEMSLVRSHDSATGLSTYTLSLVPSLWRLTQRVNQRLFQHVSIPDMVTKILGEHGVSHTWQIARELYPRLELRTQYGETDYDFVKRLLEEAGVSFFFVDEAEAENTLILTDSPHSAPLKRPPVPFVEQVFQAGEDKHLFVTRVTFRERSRPGTVTLRDYDFRRPRSPLYTTARSTREEDLAHEHYHHVPSGYLRELGDPQAPPITGKLREITTALAHVSAETRLAAQAAQVAAASETPVCDDLGIARTDVAFGARDAALRVEALDAARRLVTFETSLNDLCAGSTFAILGHPHVALGTGAKLLIVSSFMEGEESSAAAWVLGGTAVFAGAPFRPARETSKPRIYGLQSAVVVGTGDLATGALVGRATQVAAAAQAALGGASGQAAELLTDAGAVASRLVDNDIYVDEHGRVRVQLPWDREGAYDGRSSIWMRVSQGWAGGGYGLFTIPRVGHEVLVAFLDGDPDCPIVVGRVHNVVEPVPFKLPENKTVSTWKTSSSPGGNGFNELRFDDAAGREHVFLQAQKDMDHLVKHSLKQSVGKNHSRHVQNDEFSSVGHDRVQVTNHNRAEVVGLNQGSVVGVNRIATVGAEDSTHVGTRWSVSIVRGLTGRLAREIDAVLEGPLSSVARSAATTVLGLIPQSPLANAAEAALSLFGDAARARIKEVLQLADGIETDPGPPPTTIEMVDRQIKLSTGEASIVLDGPNVTISAQGNIVFHALRNISLLAEGEVAAASMGKAALVSARDDVVIQAGKNTHLNPYSTGTPPTPAERLRAPNEEPVARCAVCGEELQAVGAQLVCPKEAEQEHTEGAGEA
jgi:type VI secretion system secreted protein VgrG